MGNSIANAIANSGPTYTGGSCARLSWWWDSPIYQAWRWIYLAATFIWLVAKLVISIFIASVATLARALVAWRLWLQFTVVTSVTWLYWFLFPGLVKIADKLMPLVSNVLFYCVAVANAWLDLYSVLVVVWNSFYPLVGYFLYTYFDIVLGFWTEVVQILGEPAIGQLVFLFVSNMNPIVTLTIAFIQPALRLLPVVLTAITAQIGPIISVITNVTPFLFLIISWLFGSLFFLLEPILPLVIWAVNKVKSFFGKREAARSLLALGMRGLLLSHQITASVWDTPHDPLPVGDMGTALTADQRHLLDERLDNATAHLDARFAYEQTLPSQEEREPRAPMDTPLHEQTDWQQAPHDVSYDQEGVWADVGKAGSKYWSSTFSTDAARRELSDVTAFLQRHPHASFEYLAAENAHYTQAMAYTSQQHVMVTASEGLRPIDDPSSRMILSSQEEEQEWMEGGEREARGSGAAGGAGNRSRPWFAGDAALESSLMLESLLRHCREHPSLPECRTSEREEEGTEEGMEGGGGGGGKGGGAGAPPTMPHHLHIYMAAALSQGMPLHHMHALEVDPLDVERRHAELRRLHAATSFAKTREALAADVAAGDYVECKGSVLCGGAGARMPHPVYTAKRRHQHHARTAASRNGGGRLPSSEEALAESKRRHVLADAVEAGMRHAAARFEHSYSADFYDVAEQHATTALIKLTGLRSFTEALDHLSTRYTGAHEMHHQLGLSLGNSQSASGKLVRWLRTLDPHRDARPFYDEFMSKQVFHLRLDYDPVHGQHRPKAYIELQQQHQPTARTPLYTLELFDFLARLDCYTTTPRAPLCLPDPFPDNFHLGTDWLPLGELFPNDIDARCFCSQFFCELPRKIDRAFPLFANSLAKPDWPFYWEYWFGPCIWYNAFAEIFLGLQYFLVPGFLRLASILTRYSFLEPVLGWVFILPAGRQPTLRVFMCMTSHVYDLMVTALTLWALSFLKPLWDAFLQSTVAIPGWVRTVQAYNASFWSHREDSVESALFSEAYDSNLNWGNYYYNSPGLPFQDSRGIPQTAFPASANQADQLSPGSGAPSFADQFSRYGVGSGRPPWLQGMPQSSHTAWEWAQGHNRYRLDTQGEPQASPNTLPAYQDVVQPELTQIGAGIEDSSLAVDVDGDGSQDDPLLIEQEMKALQALMSARALYRRRFGLSPFPVTHRAYWWWRRLFGWLLAPHHMSWRFQAQVTEQQRRLQADLDARPWLGPARPPPPLSLPQ